MSNDALTRERVETMGAGRELDALVARHVMQWLNGPGYNYWMTQAGVGFELHALVKQWHPSTDPAAAKQVRERFKDWRLFRDPAISEGARYQFVIRDLPECVDYFAPTEELAVCRAALLAVLAARRAKGRP